MPDHNHSAGSEHCPVCGEGTSVGGETEPTGPPCPPCKGTGQITRPADGAAIACFVCDGSGRITAEQAEDFVAAEHAEKSGRERIVRCDCNWTEDDSGGIAACGGCPDVVRLYRDYPVHWDGKHWHRSCLAKFQLDRALALEAELGRVRAGKVRQTNTDHEGRPVPADEPPDKVVTVWTVDPHLTNRHYDYFVELSWQQMLGLVADSLDTWLETFDDDELREGVTVTFRLKDMTVRELEELSTDE